jgi:uncharacterized protein (DUF4415 family)
LKSLQRLRYVYTGCVTSGLVYPDRIDDETAELPWHAIGNAQIEPEISAVLLVVHAYREDHDGEEIIRIISARAVSVRLDAPVLAWLKSKGAGHLTRINDILTNLMEAEKTRPGK